MGDKFNEIKDVVMMISTMNDMELDDIEDLIDEVIINKVEDEDTISHVFDRLLSLVFVDEMRLKTLYYKLLDYTKMINKELSEDYLNIYLEDTKEELDLN